MSPRLFPTVDRIAYEGPESDNPLAFRWYDAERIVLGKPMREQLRFAVCYWHTFCWAGSDMFGEPTLTRPWFGHGGDAMALAARKADAAFELFGVLGVPFFTFHDRDVAPEADSLAATNAQLDRVADQLAAHMQRSGVRLLWGTANLFSHPRYAAGAATNPDPQVFAYAAAQVKQAMAVTQRLGGENYVLWGGREGYDTLLNTDLRRERRQLGRFMQLVVEHKHASGFRGTLLIEPKPMEPTKHQYDHDAAAVHGFLLEFGLEREIKLNIEANHATLAGHSFQHELAYAAANDLLGSVDANRGDAQNGWDTDQFPNSPDETALALYTILQAGGLRSGGFNFDAKLRRQSIDPLDLLHAHIGGMDAIARGLLRAARMLERGDLTRAVAQRYARWDDELGRAVLAGSRSFADLERHVLDHHIEPQPVSGAQERLENLVNRDAV
jgi:xylose isomerase